VWRRPGALDQTFSLPFGEITGRWRVGQQLADFAVHAWDLAAATDRSGRLDPAVSEAALAWGRENLRPEFRGEEGSGKQFGPEVAVPDGASVHDRLAGFFGRDPAWAGSRS
jgi:uncharacterized protein (TIGR03086 family)